MAYAAASDVGGLCRNVLGSERNFTSSTCPPITDVNTWLSSGCAIIEAHLSAMHYSVPVASTAAAYGWVKELNSLFAAAWTEMSRTNVTLAPGERTRGQVFDEMFWKQLKVLTALDLTSVGVGRSSTAPVYTGGISQSVKDTYDNDTDRVPARFRRGQWSFPGTTQPDVTSSS